jgi:CheY-like chemotaxis protein
VPKEPILVVDDVSILSVVADMLRLEGYTVQTATNGAEALHVVERDLPALVLLDMRMPTLDGWGFAHALRERNLHIPILVMAAAQSAGRWAEEIGADGYLAKPFDMEDLLSAVARLHRPRPPLTLLAQAAVLQSMCHAGNHWS